MRGFRSWTLAAALALTSSCVDAALPPVVPASGDAWTVTALDDALAMVGDSCHVRSVTIEGDTRRVRERWERPGWSLTLAHVDQTTVQVRALVTRGRASLEAFASMPAEETLEPASLLASLAHPRGAPLPDSSTLARIYRDERAGETTTLEEFGAPLFQARDLIREREGGEVSESRAAGRAGWAVESRAWVDGRERHLETRSRGEDGEVISRSVEERDANGRVVRVRRSWLGRGRTHEATTTSTYDRDGRLTSVDGVTFEYAREGDTMTRCTRVRCVREDTRGRLLAVTERLSSTSVTRDEEGRVVEVRREWRGRTTTTSVTYDAEGRRVRIATAGRSETTGSWDHGRLVRATTQLLEAEETIGTVSLERTYDDHGRLTGSVLVTRQVDAPELRSEMQITYEQCPPDTRVVLDPGHISSLESPFEPLD